MISLQDFPTVTVTVVGDRKIPPAPGANQIVGFSGYRPLTNREKIILDIADFALQEQPEDNLKVAIS